ncbi:hypothetical protein M569_02927, partial [Genlisea aurea]
LGIGVVRKTLIFKPFLLSSVNLSLEAPAMSPSKVVAEYAKSGRSSCKKCSKSIASSSLRIGIVGKDPRGFDTTKWHHSNCFPFSNTDSVSSVDSIAGFSVLKKSDQETIRNLVLSNAQVSAKVCKIDDDADNDTEQTNTKKRKLIAQVGENFNLEIVVSASDIKENYKDAILPSKWKAFQTLIYLERDDDLRDSEKIAAFDFDGCLAKTSVKRIGAEAWSLMYPSIPERLQNLYHDGHKLVIFTNEANIDRWKNKRQAAVDSKIGRLENFIKLVKVPIQVFVACGYGADDPFRKPSPGMWRIMEKEFNSGVKIDMNRSFYVGDAAGRPGDHSDSDLKFAQGVGVRFYVPEEFFISSS